MKIITATFVFNDWEYLDQTLKSIMHFGDKHYIIEGSWKSSQKFGAFERSNKQTYEIIDKYVDNVNCILVKANEPRERNQRQLGLQISRENKADWFFMTDADEVYTSKTLRTIENVLKNSSNNILGYRLKSYNFINSFKKWYDGDYMRIYRVTNQAAFYMDNDVQWPDKNGIIGKIPTRSFWHYNYVKANNSRSFWLKMDYQNEQDNTFNERIRPQYGFNNGVYKIPEDIKIYNFEGKHPKIMKEHIYFKDNIYGDNNLEFENE